jgi:hypothetical protein
LTPLIILCAQEISITCTLLISLLITQIWYSWPCHAQTALKLCKLFLNGLPSVQDMAMNGHKAKYL